MNKEKAIAALIYITTTAALIALIWTLGTFFADKISDYEVINPEEDVKCIVVSRMFNTSVDCWKE